MIINNYNKILLFSFLIMFSPFMEIDANVENDKEKHTLTFSKKDISSFSSWLSKQILHSHVPFNITLIEADHSLSKIAYVDSAGKKMHINVELVLNSKGKTEN